jgi:dihydrofolate reductase
MTLSAIVAMSREGIIGDDRGMPWHLPADLKRFKDVTMGKPMIMGRKTHEIIGRVLPGRINIVLTRDPAFSREGVVVTHSAEEALRLAEGQGAEGMIIGGGEVYRLFLPKTARLYLTVVEGKFTGTARFPIEEMLESRWKIVTQEYHAADARNPHPHQYYVLDRVAATEDGGVELAPLLAG